MTLATLKAQFDQKRGTFIEELKTFLRFQSISTNPQYAEHCVSCAQWLSSHLTAIGFRSELLPTSGKPVVFGEYLVSSTAPTVVFYGHYDVQPVDPLTLWKSNPFEPELRGKRLYARGAQDNKGQLFYVVKALETLIAAKQLNCNVKLFIEGEEEFGSGGLSEALPSWGAKTRGDLLLVCDTGTLKAGVGTITMGLRGIVHLTLRVSGLTKDLHSGVHGGVVKNPATELARLVASFHDQNGRIAVAGFYDGVKDPTAADRELANRTPMDWNEYQQQVGVAPEGGESGYTPFERGGFRPTIEINGIHSGYDGPGSKTIIPSTAMAKITSRIVGGQDPERALAAIKDHIARHAPKTLKTEVSEDTVGGPALLLSSQTKEVALAREVLREVTGGDPLFRWEGASIPIVAQFAKVSGATPLLVGFGLEEDDIHAPNESFDLGQFEQGFLTVGRLFERLSGAA